MISSISPMSPRPTDDSYKPISGGADTISMPSSLPSDESFKETSLRDRSICLVDSSVSPLSSGRSSFSNDMPLPTSLRQRIKQRIYGIMYEKKNKDTLLRLYYGERSTVANIALLELKNWNKVNGYKRLSHKDAIEIDRKARIEHEKIKQFSMPSCFEEFESKIFSKEFIECSRQYDRLTKDIYQFLGRSIAMCPAQESAWGIGNIATYEQGLANYNSYIEGLSNLTNRLEKMKIDFDTQPSNRSEEKTIYEKKKEQLIQYQSVLDKLKGLSNNVYNSETEYKCEAGRIECIQEFKKIESKELDIIKEIGSLKLLAQAKRVDSVQGEILRQICEPETDITKKCIQWQKELTNCKRNFENLNQGIYLIGATIEVEKIINSYKEKIDHLEKLMSRRLDEYSEDWQFVDTAKDVSPHF